MHFERIVQALQSIVKSNVVSMYKKEEENLNREKNKTCRAALQSLDAIMYSSNNCGSYKGNLVKDNFFWYIYASILPCPKYQTNLSAISLCCTLCYENDLIKSFVLEKRLLFIVALLLWFYRGIFRFNRICCLVISDLSNFYRAKVYSQEFLSLENQDRFNALCSFF